MANNEFMTFLFVFGGALLERFLKPLYKSLEAFLLKSEMIWWDECSPLNLPDINFIWTTLFIFFLNKQQ